MAENTKLLTARRAYEFRRDDLRLSTLCLPEARWRIQQLFNFDFAQVATPQQTFGPVAVAFPAGLVFNIGSWESPGNPTTPIRFLHFELDRIVIDVAGPSSAIEPIFDRLRYALSDLIAADGSPAIGEAERTLDYSEFTAQYPFGLEEMFAPEIRDLLSRAAIGGDQEARSITLPTFTVQPHPADEEYAGFFGDSRVLQFGLRAGMRPSDGVYFSAAPLDSETHRSYLTELETALVR